FTTNRNMKSGLTGSAKLYSHLLDAVFVRYFILEFLENSSILMMHMARVCEKIINWFSNAFKFVTLTATFTTGSSFMT
ncbi:argininosuccinate lyase, partial [Klebsiella pneumoniae]|nr:argininosuccinate lyase [Klebsiella pneumoniae]